MKPHLIRYADAERKPLLDARGRAPYFIECPRCGLLNQRGLSRRAAEAQAAAHRCSH